MKNIRPTLVCAAGTLSTLAAADTQFTVLTLNVRVDVAQDAPHTWEARRPLISAFLTELEPDLIGLQEAESHQLYGMLADNSEFASIGVGRDDGKSEGEFFCHPLPKGSLRAACEWNVLALRHTGDRL